MDHPDLHRFAKRDAFRRLFSQPRAARTSAYEIEDEIVRLHDFFVEWFNGRVPQDEDFSAVRDALGPGFVLISPRGDVDERDELLKSIWNAHGSRDGTFEIWIENVRFRHQRDLVVATYEEWQKSSEEDARGRLSTAVFGHRNDELVWLHVHETWLSENA